MARKRPVRIWVTRQRPRSEPKFHQEDRLTGAGRSIRLWFTGVMAGWDFRKGLNIGEGLGVFVGVEVEKEEKDVGLNKADS